MVNHAWAVHCRQILGTYVEFTLCRVYLLLCNLFQQLLCLFERFEFANKLVDVVRDQIVLEHGCLKKCSQLLNLQILVFVSIHIDALRQDLNHVTVLVVENVVNILSQIKFRLY